jgi:hypothetical protein
VHIAAARLEGRESVSRMAFCRRNHKRLTLSGLQFCSRHNTGGGMEKCVLIARRVWYAGTGEYLINQFDDSIHQMRAHDVVSLQIDERG